MQSLTRGWKAKRLYVLENKEAKKTLFLSPCNIYIITLKAFLVSVDKLHSGNLQLTTDYTHPLLTLQNLIAENDGLVDGPGSRSTDAVVTGTCFKLLLKSLLTFFSW